MQAQKIETLNTESESDALKGQIAHNSADVKCIFVRIPKT